MPKDIQPGVPAVRHQFARPIEYLIVLVGVLLLLGLYVNFDQNQRIAEEQKDGVIRGYKNRAVTCDQFKGLGIQEPAVCQEEVIAPYRDPRIVRGSTAGAKSSEETLKVLCWVLRQSAKNPDSRLALPPSLCPA